MDSPTPRVFYKSYNTTNTTETIYVSAPGEEAPADGWRCPYCMIVTDGDKPPAVGMFWEYPQADPQEVKDGRIILSDGLFFPDFEFYDYFASPDGKVEFDNVGLNIDCDNNDDDIINLWISTTEIFDMLCDEDECVTSFEA